MSSMQNTVSRKLAGDAGQNDVSKDVQQLIAEGSTHIDARLLTKLRQKYSNNDLVDAIVEQLAERVNEIRTRAEKFAKTILKHSGDQPLHIMLKKANKYRETQLFGF